MTMEQFLEATTVHGFVYLNRRNSFCARLFWSCIILSGFSIAGYMIYNSLIDWNANQTITTLESIATPIQKVQFPTVTVCPHEHSPPDNWSFLEKILNSIDLSDPSLRNDIINPLMTKLQKNLEKKYSENPANPLWLSNRDELYESKVLIELSKSICLKKINYGEIRKSFVEESNFYDAISKLLGEAIDNSGWTLYYCEDQCCENTVKLDFLIGIINAGYVMHSGFVGNEIALGSFLVHFANLSHSAGFGNLNIFILQEKWNADKYDGCCDKFSMMDEFLQEYFKDLGEAVGFQTNNSLSLFDIPSMLTSSFNYKGDPTDINQQQIRDAFIYSQCKVGSLKSQFATVSTAHMCFENGWKEFLKGEPGKLVKKCKKVT
jgi:hypothetical protein